MTMAVFLVVTASCRTVCDIAPAEDSVSRVQALMPMAVFLVGTAFGTESFTQKRLANMVVITFGVMIAAYGELNFVLVGVLLQLVSIAVEATRLTMVQVRFC